MGQFSVGVIFHVDSFRPPFNNLEEVTHAFMDLPKVQIQVL